MIKAGVFRCPLCGAERKQQYNGYNDETDMEKIVCGYCDSQYEVIMIPQYNIILEYGKGVEQ